MRKTITDAMLYLGLTALFLGLLFLPVLFILHGVRILSAGMTSKLILVWCFTMLSGAAMTMFGITFKE